VADSRRRAVFTTLIARDSRTTILMSRPDRPACSSERLSRQLPKTALGMEAYRFGPRGTGVIPPAIYPEAFSRSPDVTACRRLQTRHAALVDRMWQSMTTGHTNEILC